MNKFKVGQKVCLLPKDVIINKTYGTPRGITRITIYDEMIFSGFQTIEKYNNGIDSYQLSNGFNYPECVLVSDDNPIDNNTRNSLLHLLQSYIGMTPSDVGCKSWNEMQEQLADKILSMNLDVEECPFNANNESDKPTFRNCKKWKKNDHGCDDCNLFKG